MTRINYEDDMFALALQVRCLRDMLKLDIDVPLFKERILSDVSFLHAAICDLYRSLISRPSFAKRHEHLRDMQRLKRSFAALAGEAARVEGIAGSLVDGSLSFAEIQGQHETEAAEIGRALTTRERGSAEEAGIISQEELEILFNPGEE